MVHYKENTGSFLYLKMGEENTSIQDNMSQKSSKADLPKKKGKQNLVWKPFVQTR